MVIAEIISTEGMFWKNPKCRAFEGSIHNISLSEKDVKEAEERLRRFARYIAKVFPETQEMNGIIESPTVEIAHMHSYLEKMFNQKLEGKLLLKCDSHLAISGSIKAEEVFMRC